MKFFSVHCFTSLSASELRVLENRLLEIFVSEKDEDTIIAAMPVLTKLDTTKTRPLFINYIRRGSEGLKVATIVTLKKDLRKVFDDIRRELKSQGVDI
jgi:hypothetical protein